MPNWAQFVLRSAVPCPVNLETLESLTAAACHGRRRRNARLSLRRRPVRVGVGGPDPRWLCWPGRKRCAGLGSPLGQPMDLGMVPSQTERSLGREESGRFWAVSAPLFTLPRPQRGSRLRCRSGKKGPGVDRTHQLTRGRRWSDGETERLGQTRGNFLKLNTQNLPYFAVSATDTTAC